MKIESSLSKALLVILISCISTQVWAQADQAEFLEAKRLFREGKYLESQGAFRDLSESKTFSAYAKYYRGLSLYRLSKKREAITVWSDLVESSEDWENISEPMLWITVALYEIESYREALSAGYRFDSRFSSDIPDRLAKFHLKNLSIDQLVELNGLFRDEKIIADLLARKLNNEKSDERKQLLQQLIEQFDLKLEEISESVKDNVRKEKYSVALVLPFMFDGLEDPSRSVNNGIVMDFYEGVLLGQKYLDSIGQEVELYPFDTKRSKEETQAVINGSNLSDADLIIGPLFPGPFELINDFSKKEEINIVNPFSSNNELVGDNRFSFLLRSSYNTMSQALADHAISRFDNKSVVIYFTQGSRRDSVFAMSYREKMENNGFEVLDYQGVNNLEAKEILDSLVAQHEEYLIGYTWQQIDSISDLPGRFVRDRELDLEIEDEEELAEELELLTVTEEEDSVVYYEMKFNVVDDSIGHIMIASRSNGIINNFVSAIETRSDTIGLLGYGDWISFKSVNFKQLERLEAVWANPNFLNSGTEEYAIVHDDVVATYFAKPSQYHFLGFETITFLGSMLHKHGRYFQNGLVNEGYTTTLGSRFRYGLENDNQIVPLVFLKNLDLQLHKNDGNKQE